MQTGLFCSLVFAVRRLRSLIFIVAIAMPATKALMAEKPFEFASTPGKLSKQIVPTEYRIRIVPNIDKLTFTGMETVRPCLVL